MARLAPDDDEVWSGILYPDANDFGLEQAVAARITTLLAGLSRPLQSAPIVSPQLIEAAIGAVCGEEFDHIELMKGRRLSLLLYEEDLVAPVVVRRCEPWLPGGWLTAGQSHDWASALYARFDLLEVAIAEMAGPLARKMNLTAAELRDRTSEALRALASSYAATEGILWILED